MDLEFIFTQICPLSIKTHRLFWSKLKEMWCDLLGLDSHSKEWANPKWQLDWQIFFLPLLFFNLSSQSPDISKATFKGFYTFSHCAYLKCNYLHEYILRGFFPIMLTFQKNLIGSKEFPWLHKGGTCTLCCRDSEWPVLTGFIHRCLNLPVEGKHARLWCQVSLWTQSQ